MSFPKNARKKGGDSMSSVTINDLSNPAINSTISNGFYDANDYEVDEQMPLYPRYTGDILGRGQTAREQKSAREWSFYKQPYNSEAEDGTFIPLGPPLLNFTFPLVRPVMPSSMHRSRSDFYEDGNHHKSQGSSRAHSRSSNPTTTANLTVVSDTEKEQRRRNARNTNPADHILALLTLTTQAKVSDDMMLTKKIKESENRVQQVRSGRSLPMQQQDRPKPIHTAQKEASRNTSTRSQVNCSSGIHLKPACLEKPFAPKTVSSNHDVNSERSHEIVKNVANIHVLPSSVNTLASAMEPPLPANAVSSPLPTASNISINHCARYKKQRVKNADSRASVLKNIIRDKQIQLRALDTYDIQDKDGNSQDVPNNHGYGPVRPILILTTNLTKEATVPETPIVNPIANNHQKSTNKKEHLLKRKKTPHLSAEKAGVVVIQSIGNFSSVQQQLVRRVEEALAVQDIVRDRWILQNRKLDDLISHDVKKSTMRRNDTTLELEAQTHRHALLHIKQQHYEWLAKEFEPFSLAPVAVELDCFTYLQQALEQDVGVGEPIEILRYVQERFHKQVFVNELVTTEAKPQSVPLYNLMDRLAAYLQVSDKLAEELSKHRLAGPTSTRVNTNVALFTPSAIIRPEHEENSLYIEKSYGVQVYYSTGAQPVEKDPPLY